jgi:hypothetical protein
MDACVNDWAGCILWSVGGNWDRHIHYVADWFDVSAEILAALILNEMNHTGITEPISDWLAGVFGVDRASYGIGQVQLGRAERLEIAGLMPNVNEARTLSRLNEPKWNIMYVAANMRFNLERFVLPARGGNIRDYKPGDYSLDLIVLHTYKPNPGYTDWLKRGGHAQAGNTAPGHIRNVLQYLPDSVHELAVKLD